MKIIPILGRVLIKPIIPKETILRPDNAKLQPNEGIVVASSVSYLSNGDHIIFKELTGTWVDDYIIVNSTDILPVTINDILSRGNHSD